MSDIDAHSDIEEEDVAPVVEVDVTKLNPLSPQVIAKQVRLFTISEACAEPMHIRPRSISVREVIDC